MTPLFGVGCRKEANQTRCAVVKKTLALSAFFRRVCVCVGALITNRLFFEVLPRQAGLELVTMFKTSLVTHSTVDPELFPLLNVRSCVSEAEDSRNGPRYCAQDRLTGRVYEIRCCKLTVTAEPSISKEEAAVLKRQQERIDALMNTSALPALPPCVSLPIDVYIQEQASTGNTYVAAVDHFGGLSLGDILRSGWSVVEEHVFLEILNTVERYGYVAQSLPPHGNLSADALKQILVVRDGAAEAQRQSRWVVSDWLLRYDEKNTRFDPQAFVGDLDWMLHSAFSQLSITSSIDGTVLSQHQADQMINEMVDRVRSALLRDSVVPIGLFSGTVPPGATRKLSASSTPGEGTTQPSSSSVLGPSAEGSSCAQTEVSRSATNSAATATATHEGLNPVVVRSESGRGDVMMTTQEEDMLERLRHMSEKEKMAFHQNALRHEQALISKYRRRNAPLPPRPQLATTSPRVMEFAGEDDEYEMQFLTSPIKATPSQLLTQPLQSAAVLPPPPAVPQSLQQSQHRSPAPEAHGTKPSPRNSPPPAPSTSRAPPVHSPPARRGGSGHGIQLCQPRQVGTDGQPTQREVVLQKVINLAALQQQRTNQRKKAWEEEKHIRREALRAMLARNAALEAKRASRGATERRGVSQGGRNPEGGASTTAAPVPTATPTTNRRRVVTSPQPASTQAPSAAPAGSSNVRPLPVYHPQLSRDSEDAFHMTVSGLGDSAFGTTVIQVTNSAPADPVMASVPLIPGFKERVRSVAQRGAPGATPFTPGGGVGTGRGQHLAARGGSGSRQPGGAESRAITARSGAATTGGSTPDTRPGPAATATTPMITPRPRSPRHAGLTSPQHGPNASMPRRVPSGHSPIALRSPAPGGGGGGQTSYSTSPSKVDMSLATRALPPLNLTEIPAQHSSRSGVTPRGMTVSDAIRQSARQPARLAPPPPSYSPRPVETTVKRANSVDSLRDQAPRSRRASSASPLPDRSAATAASPRDGNRTRVDGTAQNGMLASRRRVSTTPLQPGRPVLSTAMYTTNANGGPPREGVTGLVSTPRPREGPAPSTVVLTVTASHSNTGANASSSSASAAAARAASGGAGRNKRPDPRTAAMNVSANAHIGPRGVPTSLGMSRSRTASPHGRSDLRGGAGKEAADSADDTARGAYKPFRIERGRQGMRQSSNASSGAASLSGAQLATAAPRKSV